jgi:shikimate kinase
VHVTSIVTIAAKDVVMNVVLMGYRGSGKSTIGRHLAERLGLDFVDVDDEVCRRLAMPDIAAVWSQLGEAAFRDAESQTVRELIADDGRVIALGGGSVMRDESRAALAAAGHCLRVYLRCDPTELLHRVRSDEKFTQHRPNRPELGGGLEQIQAMLAVREPIYKALADLQYDVTTASIEQAVDALREACRQHPQRSRNASDT